MSWPSWGDEISVHRTEAGSLVSPAMDRMTAWMGIAFLAPRLGNHAASPWTTYLGDMTSLPEGASPFDEASQPAALFEAKARSSLDMAPWRPARHHSEALVWSLPTSLSGSCHQKGEEETRVHGRHDPRLDRRRFVMGSSRRNLTFPGFKSLYLKSSVYRSCGF